MGNKNTNLGESPIEEHHISLITVVKRNSCNRVRKLARKTIPNEILEEIREKKRNDMTNQRRSMDTQPISIVKHAIVLPTNPHKKDKSIRLRGPQSPYQ